MSKNTLTWHVETRKTSELKPYKKNPRIITEDELTELKDQIQESGFHAALTIDADGVVLSGNQRLKALIELGIEEVTCIVPPRKLTAKEQERVNLRSNLHKGRWDLDVLAQEFDMDEILRAGFEDADISAIFDDALETSEDNFNTQRAIRESKNPVTKTGDRIQLGRHTLMCGDSTSIEQVEKLMGSAKANVVYSDPPYNIGLDYDKGTEGKKSTYGGNYSGKKDKKVDAQYAEFLDRAMQNAIAVGDKDLHFFWWCDEKYIGMVQQLEEKNGLNTNRVMVWIKNNSFPKPQVAFNKVYEPCVYGTRGKPWINKAHNKFNEIMNKEIDTGNQALDDIMEMINIWLVRRENTLSYEHPTQKPITLHEKPLRRCSRPGDVVVDLFGGSGSTLMACEQMNRTCYTMEQDPVFCDVIVKRWEEYTGQKAKRI